MIWSMVKVTVFLAIVMLVAFGAVLVMEAGGELRVSLGKVEFSTTPMVALLGAACLLAGFWLLLVFLGLLLAVFRFFNGDETAISRYFDRNRERRGFEALADGMVSLAVGEGREAMAHAARAERRLMRPEVANLINAQAAELSGETRKAEKYYKRLLGNRQTRVLGVRGLMKQKLEEGDRATALKLAEKALELRPKHVETINTLFALQLEQGDWEGARRTLRASVSAKGLTSGVARRREAIVVLADARRRLEENDMVGGARAAAEANRLSPALVPAAVLASELELGKGNKKRAGGILRKAWSSNPHSDLAAAFAEIEPDETPADRLKRFQQLLRLNPSFAETRLLKAELLMAAEDFPEARRALGNMAEEEPTVRSLTIMAAIARGEGAAENVVRGWLTRALNAPRGPRWTCDSCSHIHSAWAPVCDNCGAFDTLSWKAPPDGRENGESTPVLGFVAGVLTEGGAPAANSGATAAEDLLDQG